MLNIALCASDVHTVDDAYSGDPLDVAIAQCLAAASAAGELADPGAQTFPLRRRTQTSRRDRRGR